MGKKRGEVRSGLEYDVYNSSLKGTYAKYECLKIPYFKPITAHTYTPDFVLPNGIIIEVKGRLTAYDRAKHLLVKEQHPELDIRFIFKYDNKLHKSSNTRYSEWCDKQGFKYAFKTVPEQWIAEKKRAIAIDADMNKKFKLIMKILNVLIAKSVESIQSTLSKLT